MLVKNQFFSFAFLLLAMHSVFSQTNSNIEGFYKARGYGWIVNIEASKIEMYDITEISCYPSNTYPLSEFSDDINLQDNVLTLTRGASKYTFDKLDNLPDLCQQKLTKKERNNPVLNFEILWKTFEEQYAYFEERTIDWKALYKVYASQVNEKTSEVEFYQICKAMLSELNDEHVSIQASDKIMNKAKKATSLDNTPKANLGELRRAIVAKYLKDPKAHNLSRLIWGKINDDTGYVQLNDMFLQAHYGITPGMSSKEATKLYLKKHEQSANPMKDQIEGIAKTMKKVMADLADTKNLILDLRFNGGGEDMVGLEVLRNFISEEKVVFTKKNRVGDTYTKPYDFNLTPNVMPYKGKLHVLQSHWSASAAEIFLLATLSYEDITRLGSPSLGIFSDILEKKLPNGWEFGLSNQVYLDKNNTSYEALGIPVHVDFKYSKDKYEFVTKIKKDLETTGDEAIEYVLKK